MSAFNKRLRSARRARGLSQSEAAKAAGVSQQTVARWEGGASEPDLQTISTLAALYGCSREDLVSDTATTSTKAKKESLLSALDAATTPQWGFFGLSWPGLWKVSWFPISSWAAETFSAACGRRSWIVMPTLNNRILILNLRESFQCQLVPKTRMRSDWTLSWDADAGFDLAAYRELAGLRHRLPSAFQHTPREAHLLPAALNAPLLAKLKPMHRTFDFITERVLLTRIRLTSGDEEVVHARGPGLWTAVCQADADEMSFVVLREPDRERRTFTTAPAIALLDISAIRMLEGMGGSVA